MDFSISKMLKVISIDWIYTYEWVDPHAGIESTGSTPQLIRDPFLVLQINPDQYLLLEGTATYESFARSGLSDLPVQVANTGMFDLMTSSISFTHFAYEDFIGFVSKYPDKVLIASDAEEHAGDNSYVRGVIEFVKGQKLKLAFRNSSRSGCAEPITALFNELVNRGRYFPSIDALTEKGTVTGHLPGTGKINLQSFTLADLSSAALTGRLFPPHLIEINCRRRILGIDFPTKIIQSDLPIEEKESFLKDLITLRRQCHRTSVYSGEVYLLNR